MKLLFVALITLTSVNAFAQNKNCNVDLNNISPEKMPVLAKAVSSIHEKMEHDLNLLLNKKVQTQEDQVSAQWQQQNIRQQADDDVVVALKQSLCGE